uniref:Reverse transcriptase domain-containing protein n=1 Tax=Amphimedon queenslandica TaxID=400682 RepID=A0A1X7UWX7_AMPQE
MEIFQIVCLEYFKTVFSVNNGPAYVGLPTWVSNLVSVGSDNGEDVEFDLSPITPGIIRRVLSKCSNSSSPGPDGISYYHLKNLPCTHLFLATLFSKIIISSPFAPQIWCSGKILLFHKKDNNDSPENFRPIALTSTIGKLLHRIIAKRLETYLLEIGYLDSTLQKGFLSDVDGVMEHILSLNSILFNAKEHHLPLFMTFADLRNAFGSIHHQLISDMLSLVGVPNTIVSYVSDLYSKLSGSVSTRHWQTNSFNITCGVIGGCRI